MPRTKYEIVPIFKLASAEKRRRAAIAKDRDRLDHEAAEATAVDQRRAEEATAPPPPRPRPAPPPDFRPSEEDIFDISRGVPPPGTNWIRLGNEVIFVGQDAVRGFRRR